MGVGVGVALGEDPKRREKGEGVCLIILLGSLSSCPWLGAGKL